MRSIPFTILILALLVTTVACEEEDRTQPPQGWETENGKWWQTGVDTAEAFRDRESLQVMLVDYEEPARAAEGEPLEEEQFTHGVRQELLALYRHNPEVVDSLFEEYVRPEVEDEAHGPHEREQLDVYQSETYQTLREHYQEPQPATTLGDDVQLVFPDSLQGEVSGRVEMQLYLDETGATQAVQVKESVHPTLDRLAMRAATEMRWEPARIRQGDEWVDIPTWVTWSVRFGQ